MTIGDFWWGWVSVPALLVAVWSHGDQPLSCPPERPVVNLVAWLVVLLGYFVPLLYGILK